MGHDENNGVVSALAKSYELDEDTNTYTFHLRDDVKWHDGEDFTAEDVKFTIEAIMDPENESEIFSNYEDVEEITVNGDYDISFKLSEPNVAFLEYMTIGILPKHLLEGKSMQEDEFFRAPVGTGPYKFESWDEGQSITLTANEEYWGGAPSIETIIFKIVEDDNAKALQIESGELDLAKLTPKDAQNFKDREGFTVYDMKTADYRGIMYNFNNKFWQDNKELIHAINCAVDRDAMVESVLLGDGIPAYGPLARNEFNDDSIKQEAYDPSEAKKIIEENGWLNIYVGKSIRYNKTNTFSDYFREYEKVFGDRDDIIQRICKVFNVPSTKKAEKIATLLAVWNDFLINGIEPTDDMIIDDVITNWTPNKANVSRETWSEFISKIRESSIWQRSLHG